MLDDRPAAPPQPGSADVLPGAPRAGERIAALRTAGRSGQHLGEVARWIVQALDSVVAFGHVQGQTRSGRDPGAIFLAARSQLDRLLRFRALAFLTVSEASEFVLADCEPSSERSSIQKDIDAAVCTGLFALGVAEDRPVMAPSTRPDHTLVLRSLVSGSRVVGMFAGLLRDDECDLNAAASSLLSLILFGTAQALENATLYQRISAHARDLGQAVEARTRELQQALAQEARLRQSVQQAYDELSRTKDQLAQAQKIDAIGRLAGGIAHDFNNLLTVISGRTHLVRHALPPDDPLRRDVEIIRQTARRAGTLTQQLLAFSRKQVLAPKVLDLNAVVADMESLLRRLIGEHVELVAECDPGAGRVEADVGQLEQVIVNLAVNARDAMPGGGRLVLATSSVELDAAFVRDHPGARAGRYVRLEVTDTGVGMDAEVQAHLFEPFFTTKGVGQGTGLGLATVYGIVKQSGGYIWVDSEPGRGSRFAIYLPRVAGAIESPAPSEERARARRGSETILVVEDEERVRALVGEALEQSGYTVLEAVHGGHALQLLEGYTGSIDLVLTDVVMPQMSGRQLADRLATLRPGARVLFMSGYPDDILGGHGILAPDTAFLAKPFTPDVLVQEIRAVLEAR